MARNLATLRTIRQFTEENPAFTNDYLHYLIRNSARNGIEACLVRVGAKVFVDTEMFAEWLQTQPHAHDRGGRNKWTKGSAKPAHTVEVGK
jgi:hypothetical protein